MGTSTTRLALYKPSMEDPVNVDTDLNENFLKIEKYIAFSECTSLTRPAEPWEGLKIYETDTGLLYIYALGAWVVFVDLPPIVSAGGGRKAFVKVTTSSAAITGTETNAGLNATFVSELGRRYWVEVTFRMASSLQQSLQANMRWAAGTTVTTSGTALNGSRLIAGQIALENTGGPSGTALAWYYGLFEFLPNVAGNVTVGLFLIGDFITSVNRSCTGTAETANSILVRDVGA